MVVLGYVIDIAQHFLFTTPDKPAIILADRENFWIDKNNQLIDIWCVK